MRIMTFKLKPKQLFGVILALTGIIVIVLTFISNHSAKPAGAQAKIKCATTDERLAYLSSLGYETDGNERKKEILIPSKFNKVYREYSEIQKKQGFSLEKYKGKKAVLYTYKIINYKNNENVTADLMVENGVLIGADLCDPSADDGFLIALGKNGTA